MVIDQQAASSDLAGTLRALRRRWWLVLMCWLIVVATAAAWSFTATKEYSATPGCSSATGASTRSCSGRPSSPRTSDPAREAATNVKLVSLDIVAQRTAPSFPGLTAKEMSDQDQGRRRGQSDVVSVTATDHDPVRARDWPTRSRSQYIEYRRDSDRAKIRGAQALVQQRISTLTPAPAPKRRGPALSERADQFRSSRASRPATPNSWS